MYNTQYAFQYIVIETKNLHYFNPLPNEKFLGFTTLKAFADHILKFTKVKISLFGRVEITVGKGENAGYQDFLLFPQCFPKPSSLGSLKVGIVW